MESTEVARRRGAVAALYLTTFMVLLDVNVVVTALPALQADLHATPATVQWVMGAYTICLATLALSAGALGDRYGRKRMFLIGVTLFVAGSAGCAVSTGTAMLLIGRFAQGVGGAIAMPGTLSLLAQTVRDPRERAKVIAGSAMVSGLGALVGPTVGGLLIGMAGWQSVFLINLPIGVVILWLSTTCLNESADPEHASVDLPGQVLGIAWMGGFSLGLINGGTWGWRTAWTVVPLLIGAVCLVAFVAVELRQRAPMLPLRWFRRTRFAVPNVASFALGFTAFTLVTLLPSYLQQAQNHSAVAAAVLLLPAAVAGVIAPHGAGRWVHRSGPAWPIVAGYILVAASAVVLLAEHPGAGFLVTAVAGALLGAGSGLALSPTNAAVVEAVGRERSGTGSATVYATRQAGTTLGIALLGSVIAGQLTSLHGRSVAEARTDGLHLIAVIAAVAALLVSGLVLSTRRKAFG
jgi:EmrB/QacA subfamily drug resistance transporter